MTFLKKLGSILAKGVVIAAQLGGLALPFLGSSKAAQVAGTAVNDLTQIAGVVTTAEALNQTPGSGAQKLAAATPLVMSILKSTELIAGKKIANETLFQSAATQITAGMADLLNSIHPDEAKTA